MSTNYVDFSQAYKALQKAGKNADAITAKALNEAGDYARRMLVVKTPYFKGKLYKNTKKANNTRYRTYDKMHAKHHVVASKATRGKHQVEIGYDVDVAWKIHFAEFGTIKQKPQGFIQRTMKDVEAKVASIIEDAMRRAFLK